MFNDPPPGAYLILKLIVGVVFVFGLVGLLFSYFVVESQMITFMFLFIVIVFIVFFVFSKFRISGDDNDDID